MLLVMMTMTPGYERVDPPLEILVGGCYALFRQENHSSLCLQDKEPRRVVLLRNGRPPLSAERVWWNGRLLDPERVEVGDHLDQRWWTIDPPADTGRLHLADADGSTFVLDLAPLSDVYQRERQAARERSKDGMIANLDAPIDLDPHEAFWIECNRTLFHRKQNGHDRRVQRLLATGRNLGDQSCTIFLLVNELHEAAVESDFRRMASALEGLKGLDTLDARRVEYGAYFRGELEQQLGQFDRALASLRISSRLAELTSKEDQYIVVLDKLALVQMKLGMVEEALATIDELRLHSAADVLANALWTLILYRESLDHERRAEVPDPYHELERLLVGFQKDLADEVGDASGTRAAKMVSKVTLNLAIAATQRDDYDAAARLMKQLDNEELRPHDRAYAELVLARIAGPEDFGAAARHLQRADELSIDASHSLQIALDRAELERRVGHLDQALAYFARADDIAERAVLGIGRGGGRSALWSAHVRQRAAYLSLLAQLGRREDVMALMLGARARHYRALSAQDRARRSDNPRIRTLRMQLAVRQQALAQLTQRLWDATNEEQRALERTTKRASDEIDALWEEAALELRGNAGPWRYQAWNHPGTARLAMHPAPGKGRWMFAFEPAPGESSEVAQRIHLFEVRVGPGPEGIAGAVDEVFVELDGRLNELEALTVVPVGRFVDADFHTPMALQLRPIRVAYSLGIGPGDSPTPSSPSALVLAGDTRKGQDLRDARTEVQAIADGLLASGWSVRNTWTIAHEPAPTLFHFAGHGKLAGDRGWSSYLALGTERRLTSAEVIVQSWAPSVVVLDACETGATDAEVGMNMATAFIVAGSTMVLAPLERIEDDVARELSERLYADPLPIDDLGRSLHQRLTEIQADDPRFRSWQVWVP